MHQVKKYGIVGLGYSQLDKVDLWRKVSVSSRSEMTFKMS